MIFKEQKLAKFSETHVTERTFEGFASAYGNVDSDNDIIHYGAFAKSIKEGFPAGRIKVLYQHLEPLGMPVDMREESGGLYVKAKISKTRLGDEVIELMKDGVIDTMSVGFVIPRGKSEYDDKGIRHIYEGKLLEFSPVTFPANEKAVITGLKTLKEIAAFAKNTTVGEQVKKELLAEIENIKALLKNEPGSTTHFNSQPLKEVDELIKQTFGALALELK